MSFIHFPFSFPPSNFRSLGCTSGVTETVEVEVREFNYKLAIALIFYCELNCLFWNFLHVLVLGAAGR